MDLSYSWERLYRAVRSAIWSDRPLQQRLLDCYLELHTLDYEGRLPRHLRSRFKEMIDTWTREPGTTSGEWSVRATLEKMGDDEARRWLDELLKLYTSVVESKASAEAYLRKRRIRDEQNAANLTRLQTEQWKATEVFNEIYQLLEDLAPVWYSEELRKRAKKALLLLGRDPAIPIARHR